MEKQIIPLIDLLCKFTPSTTQEQEYKELILNFLATYSNAFDRNLEVGHITASCWLINKNNTHALLCHHRKLNMWVQLGGHCDGNPNVLEVAIKEAKEESGIMSIQPVSYDIFDIDVHKIPETKKEKAHYHYDIRFLLQVISDEKIQVSDESHALMWIDKNKDTVPTYEESVIRMFHKWIKI